jgi:GTP-binding protein HflX
MTDEGNGRSAMGNGRAVVIHPLLRDAQDGGRSPEARLAEAVGLDVVHAQVVKVARPTPGTLLGSGAVEQLARIVETLGEEKRAVTLVVVDHALSPIQQRNLERALKTKVIDRTSLILEIFGARARTREGQLQVELAALSYQRSRLVRSWTHLERQRGGFGFLGGPGESQLEIDRRLILERIVKLKKELEEVRRTRGLHRRARERVPYPVVALVGYTNAGKSTLFNRMAGAEVFAKDLLFATLDPTMRAIVLPTGRRVILSDTVGFISDLPTHLVAAFRATLEEVEAADVILHVRDVAHPDTEAQKADVEAVLRDIGIDVDTDRRVVEVLNKIDLLDAGARATLLNQTIRSDAVVPLSAATGEGVDRLFSRLDRFMTDGRTVVDLTVPLTDGAAIAWLYERGEVLERRDGEVVAHLHVALDHADLARFERRYDYRHH